VWIWRWVDGALLVDLWEELDIPVALRDAWQPFIDHARNGPQEDPIYVGVDHSRKQDRDERKERIAAAAQRLAKRDRLTPESH